MKDTKAYGNRKSLSIRYTIIILFIALMFATVGGIGILVFSNWWSTTDKSVTKIAVDMNNDIFKEIEAFINNPVYINEFNQGLIYNHVVNINNPKERERFFVNVLNAEPAKELYSYTYGMETGEYYGARRNSNNEIEILKNNSSTGGNSWYYEVKEDMTAGDRVFRAGQFDPRTRDWYIAAKEIKKPIFSPIYKHFIRDDLAISSAYPIYDREGDLVGVLGAHIILSQIDNYLKETVSKENAFAVIIEKNTGYLISNTLDYANFEMLPDGSMKRTSADEIDNEILIKTLKQYKMIQDTNYNVKHDGMTYHINVMEYQKTGIDWVVISGIPESTFMSHIFNTIKITILLTMIVLVISTVIYFALTNKFLNPINSLIKTTEKYADGDLSQRAEIHRNNEIGKLSKAFNKMADTIYMLVNDLETKVKTRTLELEETNNLLNENKEQLSLILNSTAEAIYGMDMDLKCTFCNSSCLKILGYQHHSELIGKNVHALFHHSYKDGKPMPLAECKIHQALLDATGTHADDEVFWRADGSYVNVEYYSYPQFKDGEVIGAVVTFRDNTERKHREERIKYLSYHDSLTGLYNRMYFEDAIEQLDMEENLPIAIVYCDVNGLKLTNDVFGHNAGDELLKKSAEVLQRTNNGDSIIARVGGDEFAILLTKVTDEYVSDLVNSIKELLSKEKIAAIKCSMSIGYDRKTKMDQDIYRTLKIAEDEMYKLKIMNRNTVNSDMVTTLIESLHSKSAREKAHSETVSKMCIDVGKAMKLSEPEIKKLADAGYYHDIGKIMLEEELLNNRGQLKDEEKKTMQQHAMVGYRILNLFDETIDISEAILSHHERWDGLGYPKGLKGEEIPILSRIIAIVEGYDSMTNAENQHSVSHEEALQELIEQSGIKFDPSIVDIFVSMMKEHRFT